MLYRDPAILSIGGHDGFRFVEGLYGRYSGPPWPHLRYRRDWPSDDREGRVLQQMWKRRVDQNYETEWRDVPVADE